MTSNSMGARLPLLRQRRPAGIFPRDGRWVVYLAVHPASDRFKVGVAIDPLERFQRLPEASGIDRSLSVARDLPNQKRALAVESALHKVLCPYAHPAQHRGDGYSEWFRLEGYAIARLVLDAVQDALGPATSLAKPGRMSTSAALVDMERRNISVTLASIQLWREAAKVMAVEIAKRGQCSALVLRGFRGHGLLAGTGLRTRLQDLEGRYALCTPPRQRISANLVHLIAYDGPMSDDLVITLQPSPVLRRLPGGAEVARILSDGLQLMALERRVRRRTPALSEEQISAGLGRLLERKDEANDNQASLWD
jgi:hypothetical protein